MSRVRVSTTVSEERLLTCRRRLGLRDSQLLDAALQALIDQLETADELAALAAHPYEDDPDLAWVAPDLPDLPYDEGVPAEVLRLAEQRRKASPA